MKRLKIGGSQFGFQRGLSATVKLLHVYSTVRAGRNKIAKLDLLKAYDKAVR